jgi:hypothetical protein
MGRGMIFVGAGYAVTDFLYQGTMYVYQDSGDAWKPWQSLNQRLGASP